MSGSASFKTAWKSISGYFPFADHPEGGQTSQYKSVNQALGPLGCWPLFRLLL